MFSVRMRSERVYHLIKLISLANMAEVISSEVLLLLQQLVAEAETRPSQCHGHITVHLNPPPPQVLSLESNLSHLSRAGW